MDTRSDSSLSADDAEALRTFALRLIHIRAQTTGPQPQFLVGHLPENLPVEIPFPDGYLLAGSLVQADHIRIIFDTVLSREDVSDFYREQLLIADWRDLAEPHSVFVSSGIPGYGRFCFGNDGPTLTIFTLNDGTQLTDVELSLSLDSGFVSRLQRSRKQSPDTILPDLLPPNGAKHHFGGRGWNGNQESASATLTDGVESEDDVEVFESL